MDVLSSCDQLIHGVKPASLVPFKCEVEEASRSTPASATSVGTCECGTLYSGEVAIEQRHGLDLASKGLDLA